MKTTTRNLPPHLPPTRGEESEANLLDQVPVRADVAWEEIGDKVRLKLPRFRSRIGNAFRRLFRASPFVPLPMDEMTSLVWKAIDGTATVAQVGERLRAAFGERAEPLHPRLAELLAILERNRLIRYRERPSAAR